MAIGVGRAASVTVWVTTEVGKAMAGRVWLEFIRLGAPPSARFFFPPPSDQRERERERNGRPTNLARHWASSTKYHERIMWDKIKSIEISN